ncbi:MAG TPA: glycosyltransferase family 4 protein [Solirubrobacterales bacterium]|nr:glycosyltransferase family 4 protein [Solirubrobacterales bacterium]
MASDPAPDARPRIGLAFPGDVTNPASWSGTPSGLHSGLTAAGAEPIPIDTRFRGSDRVANALRMSWAQATANGAFAAASGLTANRAARRAALDGVVAIGSGFVLSEGVPAVSFEDMTVAQAMRREEDPAYRSVSAGAARRWRRRQQLIYERSRACCVTSGWVAESIHRDYGVPPSRIRVVGLGHNVEVAANPERDWNVPRFIFAGVDWDRKRGSAVVEAFIALRQRHPGASLDLVGEHPRIEVEGVTGHGRLRLDSRPEQRHYAELLRRATCFVMPSSYEPFGIAHVDAAAAGVPSIGTTVGGVPDTVGPGGVVVDPGDDDALLEAMFDLADPQTARRLGALAQQHASLFTWRAVGERILHALAPPGVDLTKLSGFLPFEGERLAA